VLVRLGQEVQEVPRGIDPVREFIRAFNERDLDAFVAVLDPEIELHSMKGLRKGRDAARLWATRAPGGVQQTIELEELFEDGDRALALVRRAWHWDEDGSHASTDEMAWLFELRDHTIRGWRPFDDREAAWRAYHVRNDGDRRRQQGGD
jgi:ketosteroid isomerase-like protein